MSKKQFNQLSLVQRSQLQTLLKEKKRFYSAFPEVFETLYR